MREKIQNIIDFLNSLISLLNNVAGAGATIDLTQLEADISSLGIKFPFIGTGVAEVMIGKYGANAVKVLTDFVNILTKIQAMLPPDAPAA